MKSGPKISLLLNLVLAGGLIYLLVAGRRPVPVSPQPVVAATPSVVTAAPPPQVAPRVKPAPFRWRQLDSTNYHVYVENLRDIGCPEPSLRAIVTADVDVVFGLRRRALEKKLADLAGASLGVRLGAYNTEQSLETELQQLPEAETRMINDLLGLKPAPDPLAAADASASPSDGDDAAAPEAPPVTMPVACQDFDLAALGLTEDQIQIVEKLRQSFLDKIGGPNQDPNDPAYLARWQQAQPGMDAALSGMLGPEAYTKFLMAQSAAANQAAEEAQPQN